MILFIRIFTISFLFALVGTITMWLTPITKPPLYRRIQAPRNIPISRVQACAAQANDQLKRGGQLPSQAGVDCLGGYLLGGGFVPDHSVVKSGSKTDDAQIMKAAEGSVNPVFLPALGQTAIAVRTDPRSANSPLFVAWMTQSDNSWIGPRSMVLAYYAFIASFIAMLMAVYFVRPISLLSEATRQFGAGDLSVRVAPSFARRRDEVGRISRGFNDMALQIESLVAGQREFLAHAAHELGSPLTRLNIALALCTRKADPASLPELEKIRCESSRLNEIMRELLFYARIESGTEFDHPPTVFLVSDVLNETIDNARFEAEQQNKSVEIVTDEAFEVSGYPHLLQRGFDNVLRNAIRFAQKIEIRTFISSDRKLGVVEISDDGPGVPKGMEEEIFKPFVTATASTSGTVKGAGLGLTISRQAARANQGRVFAYRGNANSFVIRFELPVLLPSS